MYSLDDVKEALLLTGKAACFLFVFFYPFTENGNFREERIMKR